MHSFLLTTVNIIISIRYQVIQIQNY